MSLCKKMDTLHRVALHHATADEAAANEAARLLGTPKDEVIWKLAGHALPQQQPFLAFVTMGFLVTPVVTAGFTEVAVGFTEVVVGCTVTGAVAGAAVNAYGLVWVGMYIDVAAGSV